MKIWKWRNYIKIKRSLLFNRLQNLLTMGVLSNEFKEIFTIVNEIFSQISVNAINSAIF